MRPLEILILKQRPCQARPAGIGFVRFTAARDFGHEQRHHLFQKGRLAPESVKRLIEQFALVASCHKHGMQRPVEISTLPKAAGLDSADRVKRSPGPNRQTGAPQDTSEMHDVLGKPSTVVVDNHHGNPRLLLRGRGKVGAYLVKQAFGLAAFQACNVILVLEQHPQRIVDRRRIENHLVEG